MGKAPCFGERAPRLSGGYAGLSLIAVCNNKLLDLERKLETHPPTPYLKLLPPFFLMPGKVNQSQ